MSGRPRARRTRPDAATGAADVTLAPEPGRGRRRAALHAVLQTRCAAPARAIVARPATCAWPVEGCLEWLQRWIDAGARHVALRFGGGDQLARVDGTASRLLPRLEHG